MDTDSNIKRIVSYLILATLFSLLVSLYMRGTTCMCITEYMQGTNEINENLEIKQRTINNVRHGEAILSNPTSNLLFGWAEKFIYLSQDNTPMFRLHVSATLYDLDDPYIVYLDGKESGKLTREQGGYHKLTINSENTDLFFVKEIKVTNNEGVVLEGTFV